MPYAFRIFVLEKKMAYRYFAFAISLCFLRLLPVINGQSYTPDFKDCACGAPKQCDYARMKCAPPDDNCNKENVALGKPSSMSSRIDGPVNFKEYSCLVVDGIIEPIFRSPNDTDNPNCVVTKRGDKNPFWEVDLMAIYTVTHITYSVPADRDQHMKFTQVYVDSGLCKQFPTTTTYVPAKDEIYCNPPIKGRKIKFVKPFVEGPGDDYTIPLCEVQVWVCVQGYYGKNCDEFCGGCNFCENYYGECIGGCKYGYYGFNCSFACDSCLNRNCSNTTGECLLGCGPGWIGQNCSTQCNKMSYGDGCKLNCTNCIDDECSSIDGICSIGCVDGFEGDMCDKPVAVKEEPINPIVYFAAALAFFTFIGILLLVYSKVPAKKKRRIVKVKKKRVKKSSKPAGDVVPVELEGVVPETLEGEAPESPPEGEAEGEAEGEEPNEEQENADEKEEEEAKEENEEEKE